MCKTAVESVLFIGLKPGPFHVTTAFVYILRP